MGIRVTTFEMRRQRDEHPPGCDDGRSPEVRDVVGALANRYFANRDAARHVAGPGRAASQERAEAAIDPILTNLREESALKDLPTLSTVVASIRTITEQRAVRQTIREVTQWRVT